MYINKIFPGASSLLMSAMGQQCSCDGPCHGSCNKLGNVPIAPEDCSDKILGMISHKSDLLLFNRAINYHPRAEVWLLKTEYGAQETVGKLIGHAVSSFPRQPLDEWIIDYPQQTILSTIHLILTHEINEMLHDMRAARGTEGASMTHTGQSETLGDGIETSQVDTRSIQLLKENSKVNSNLDQSEATNLNKPVKEVDETKEKQEEDEGEGKGDKQVDKQSNKSEGESSKSQTIENNLKPEGNNKFINQNRI
jgi:hypothetical protein